MMFGVVVGSEFWSRLLVALRAAAGKLERVSLTGDSSGLLYVRKVAGQVLPAPWEGNS